MIRPRRAGCQLEAITVSPGATILPHNGDRGRFSLAAAEDQAAQRVGPADGGLDEPALAALGIAGVEDRVDRGDLHGRERADVDVEPVMRELLGDLLLHIVFSAKIASEKGDFDMEDVIRGINDKLGHRHPHVFGDVEAHTDEQVAQNWEKLKLKEGKKSVLEGVPRSLPALVKASRIQDKAASSGFDWEKAEQVMDKVLEEIRELQVEVSGSDRQRIEAEFGDVLFSLINYARFIDVDPESALERTNKKFISRFQFMEQQVEKDGKKLHDLSLNELEKHWIRSKDHYQ